MDTVEGRLSLLSAEPVGQSRLEVGGLGQEA